MAIPERGAVWLQAPQEHPQGGPWRSWSITSATFYRVGVMTSLFVDLEGAFDSASHEGILRKLASMGSRDHPPPGSGHSCQAGFFQVGGWCLHLSFPPMQRGVPQGSIPQPFAVQCPPLRPPHSSPTLTFLSNADDITIISRANTQAQAQLCLQGGSGYTN
ncbi:hypothetical protein GWK47_039186 [Chionoecetes opilio]|uniref:Reverse transcriptase domain-containing protein n=1 Tax=Chionoecetes opilio TaxID=41210 RepID=A0A8J5D1G2_CHIOP|nr:hypothetical protein GWK47_039186 [Chionoecetes opilio]